jgi:hypothetical protein
MSTLAQVKARKNQEVTLARAGDTRWGSHHKIITSLIKMFREVLKVLHYVEEKGANISNRGTTSGLIKYFKTLDFVFLLYLLLYILGLTNTLSRHLQKSDQTILCGMIKILLTWIVLQNLLRKW